MVDYIIEFYEKNARKPYKRIMESLPYGCHPKFTNTQECFNFKLAGFGGPARAVVKYASNGAVAATKYVDANGNGRLRWVKEQRKNAWNGPYY